MADQKDRSWTEGKTPDEIKIIDSLEMEFNESMCKEEKETAYPYFLDDETEVTPAQALVELKDPNSVRGQATLKMLAASFQRRRKQEN